MIKFKISPFSRNALLSHIISQTAATSTSAATIDAAIDVLEAVAEMAEDEESEEILGKAMELYRKLEEAKWEEVMKKWEDVEGGKEEGSKKKWEQIGETLASRMQELEQERRGRERKRTMIEMVCP